MIRRRDIIAIAVILGIFAIGALGYMAFSADKPDGLEATMEEAEVEEQEPVFHAPLSYGDGYFEYVAMGVLGFACVMAVSLLLAKLMARRNEA